MLVVVDAEHVVVFDSFSIVVQCFSSLGEIEIYVVQMYKNRLYQVKKIKFFQLIFMGNSFCFLRK